MQRFTPAEYLMIDVATSFGLGKTTWDERLEWFAANEPELARLAAMGSPGTQSPASHSLIKTAKEPAQFFAGVKAWDRARRGDPISHLVHLDATASGAQLLSILIDCFKSGSNCNLVDTGRRENLYENLYQAISQRAGQDLDVSADAAKLSVMSSLYGSKRQPRLAFGTGIGLEAFYDSMTEELPGAWALNEALIDLWQADALSHDWVLPDNFHVRIKVMTPIVHPIEVQGRKLHVTSLVNEGSKTGLSLAANVTHAVDGMVVREMTRRCSYDPEKLGALRATLDEIERTGTYSTSGEPSPDAKLVTTLWSHYLESGFLSARILELLDTETLHLVNVHAIAALVATLPKTPFPLLSIHDSFACHPNYANEVRRQYNQVLHDLAKSEILAFVVSRITGRPTAVAKFGGDLASHILEANYTLS
jgi:hypothetical protein